MAGRSRKPRSKPRSGADRTRVRAPTRAAAAGLNLRVGHGYDLHRLEPAGPGRRLLLGGVLLEADVAAVGHSDADALLHAVTDAILGALALPDIGQLFPDTDPRWKGADSAAFVGEALRLANEAGWSVGNVDATVVLEHPRLAAKKDAIRERLAALLHVEPDRVNVKGKTHERVDAVGEGRAVEAHAVVLLVRQEP